MIFPTFLLNSTARSISLKRPGNADWHFSRVNPYALASRAVPNSHPPGEEPVALAFGIVLVPNVSGVGVVVGVGLGIFGGSGVRRVLGFSAALSGARNEDGVDAMYQGSQLPWSFLEGVA